MSKRTILSNLKKKNIFPVSVYYSRGCVTPSGYTEGWDIKFSEQAEDLVYSIDSKCKFSTFMEFDDLNAVLKWIKTLPIITS